MPAMVVVPVTVMFEKLLLLKLLVLLAPGSLPIVRKKNVTVPLAPVLLKLVTIELPLTFFVAPAGAVFAVQNERTRRSC